MSYSYARTCFEILKTSPLLVRAGWICLQLCRRGKFRVASATIRATLKCIRAYAAGDGVAAQKYESESALWELKRKVRATQQGET